MAIDPITGGEAVISSFFELAKVVVDHFNLSFQRKYTDEYFDVSEKIRVEKLKGYGVADMRAIKDWEDQLKNIEAAYTMEIKAKLPEISK